VPLAIAFDQSPSTPIAVTDRSHLEATVRFDRSLHQLSELSAGIVFNPTPGGPELNEGPRYVLLTGGTAANIECGDIGVIPWATAVNANPEFWPLASLKYAHAALRDDYDVAEAEAISLQASKRYGW
jgi:hypothetical protein